jgi:protoporphyrinogen oxidase
VTQVAVIGAGITGLAAAWELRQGGAEPIVLECERRTGGVIVTERRDGFVVEGGPDGFLAAEPDIPRLAGELGIGDRLVDQLAKGSFLWTGAALERLSEGEAAVLLGISEPVPEDLRLGFRSFAGGMAELVDTITTRLGSAVATTTGVAAIARSGTGYRLALTDGAAVAVDGVICAVPAWATARLVASVGVPQARALDDVLYFPSLTVSLAYHREQVQAELAGTGFVTRRATGDRLRACTYASLKYPGRSPAGFLLLRAFLGPVEGDPAAVAQAELGKVLAISGAPLWTRAFHWVRGLPRYRPEHAARVAAIRERLVRLPPLAIAGAGVDRAGVSACVGSGRAAARAVLEALAG